MNTDIMELVAAVRGGDRGAASQIMHALLPDLRAYVRVHAGERIRARESRSDLVQSICREVLEDLADFDGSHAAQFKKWLFALAMNKIRERHRFYGAERRDVGREVARVDSASASADETLLTAYSRIVTPSRIAQANEQVRLVESSMDELPEEYRTVLTLSCILGMSHREVAQEMGRAETATRKLLSRARARLSLILAQSASRPGG